MPAGAKLRKDKVSAVLLPGFVMWVIEASPSSMQCMPFPKPLICKILLQPLRLSHVTNPSSVYIFDNGLLVNYNAGKNGGNNLTLDATKKKSFWASNSLSQSLSHPTYASPGCLPSICRFYSQQFNHSLAMWLNCWLFPSYLSDTRLSFRCTHCWLGFQDLPYTQSLVIPAKKLSRSIFSLA